MMASATMQNLGGTLEPLLAREGHAAIATPGHGEGNSLGRAQGSLGDMLEFGDGRAVTGVSVAVTRLVL